MKEFKDYLKLFKKYLALLVLLVVVSSSGVFWWVIREPKNYQASATLYVNKIAETSTPQYYTFEGYYSGLASIQYTDVVVGMLKTPDLARLALVNSGINVSESYLLSRLQVKKLGPQLVSVSLTDANSDQAKKLLLTLSQAAGERSKKLTSANGRGIEVTQINPDPLVVEVKHNLAIYLAGAIFGSLLLGVLFVITREYFLS